VRLLPKTRRGRLALAGGLLALLLGGYWFVFEYRPREAHYKGRPTSWWARECSRLEWGGSVSAWRYLSLSYTPVPPDGLDGAVWEQWLRQLGVPLPFRPVDERLLRGDPAAVPVLIELLRSPEDQSRTAGAYGLGRVGPAAREAAPELLGAYAKNVTFDAARLSLRRIDPDALDAYERGCTPAVRAQAK
jgi:hypothetical protein